MAKAKPETFLKSA